MGNVKWHKIAEAIAVVFIVLIVAQCSCNGCVL